MQGGEQREPTSEVSGELDSFALPSPVVKLGTAGKLL
jgi:hypothetical protein